MTHHKVILIYNEKHTNLWLFPAASCCFVLVSHVLSPNFSSSPECSGASGSAPLRVFPPSLHLHRLLFSQSRPPTCDVSARCFPSTTLFCWSELDAVAHRRRNDTQGRGKLKLNTKRRLSKPCWILQSDQWLLSSAGILTPLTLILFLLRLIFCFTSLFISLVLLMFGV